MKKILTIVILLFSVTIGAVSQAKKVYDETIDPMEQIDEAVVKAKKLGKFVICQVGGNWCPWCLRLADFIDKDEEIKLLIEKNYEYIHVNYPRKDAVEALMKKLKNPGRFGYPVLVVLNQEGEVIHIQDSSFLEEGKAYNKEKVLRFLEGWKPSVI